MKKILCQVCKTREKTQVKEGQYCCNECRPPKLWHFYVKGQTYLRDYGNISTARIEEAKRTVLLPKSVTPEDKANGIDYYIGRHNENGTISEKQNDVT